MTSIAYENVYKSLKKAITTGIYPKQSPIPPEPQLCKMYGVSRTTIRKAVEILTSEGYVKPQRGIGTIVLNERVAQDVNKLHSLTETLKSKGYEVSLRKYYLTVTECDKQIAEKLKINIGDKIVHISRVTCASDKPIAIIHNYIPYIYVQGIEKSQKRYISLYKMLEEEYGLLIRKTNDKIFAKNASENEAKLLDVKKGDALIVVDRVCINGENTVCYDIVTARSDMYEYQVSLFNN